MKKYSILFLVLFYSSLNTFSQEIDEESDSIFYEIDRNYFGSNISPLLSGVVSGRDNFNVKLNVAYKRNFGAKNMRMSLNYLTEGNLLPYDYFNPISTTDTSFMNRYFDNSYDHFDFRFGFEELRGYNGARIHVGVDAILGYGINSSKYFDRLYTKDTSGYYILNNDVRTSTYQYSIDGGPSLNGYRHVDYIITGVDVSFGFDWVLNESFIFTLQVSPQFNYYIFLDETNEDQYGEYQPVANYADFKLGYIDLMLFYRF